MPQNFTASFTFNIADLGACLVACVSHIESGCSPGGETPAVGVHVPVQGNSESVLGEMKCATYAPAASAGANKFVRSE